MHFKFAGQQGLFQPLQIGQFGAGGFVFHRVKQEIAIAPGLLGDVHGLIGMAKQQFRFDAIARENGNPDTG